MNAVSQKENLVLDMALEPRAERPLVAQPLPAVAVTPADLLRIAMESGDKDIERLERLMAMDIRYREMQEEDRKRACMLAFRADFVGLGGENIIIPKLKHVDRGRAGSFEQAEFDEVKRRLSPALCKHGFGFRHDQKFGTKRQMFDGVENDVAWVWVTCFLDHKAGHSERIDLEGPPGDLNGNTVVQNMQATATYLIRVSLLAITGTATGGADDESKLRKLGTGAANSDRVGDLRSAGNAAATGGLKALTGWWGKLTDKERADLSKDFGEMRKAARRVDEEAL